MAKNISSPFRVVTKAESISTAQSAELCDERKMEVSAVNSTIVDFLLRNNEPTLMVAVIGLMSISGLRISEVLNITGSNILPNGFIVIKASKGSNNRILKPIHAIAFWESFRGSSSTIGSTWSRFFFYREFKKLGISATFGDNVNASTTHFFRHNLIRSLHVNGVSDEVIQSFSGHKSIKSVKEYVTKEN